MDWKKISVNQESTCFMFENSILFGNKFERVLKFHHPGIAPVKYNGYWNFINADGVLLSSDRFLQTFGFYCGIAAVCDLQGYFHVDENIKPIYDNRFLWVGNFQEQKCVVLSENGFFHIKDNGQQLYSETYVYAGDYKDNTACVSIDNDHWFHINEFGENLYDVTFMGIGQFHKGLATARDIRGCFHIDIMGNQLYEQRYLLVEPFYNRQALVITLEGQYARLSEDSLKLDYL